jgi:hypothetical protein
MNLQLTTIAGAGIDVADTQGTAKDSPDMCTQGVPNTQGIIGGWRRFGDNSDRGNLA